MGGSGAVVTNPIPCEPQELRRDFPRKRLPHAHKYSLSSPLLNTLSPRARRSILHAAPQTRGPYEVRDARPLWNLALTFSGKAARGLGPAVCEAAQERRFAHGMTSFFVLEMYACSGASDVCQFSTFNLTWDVSLRPSASMTVICAKPSLSGVQRPLALASSGMPLTTQ